MSEPMEQGLLERLAKIEAQYKRLKTPFVVAVLIVVLTISFGAIAVAMPDAQRASQLSTTRLVVTDTSGKMRAEIATGPTGPFLQMYDDTGTPRLTLSIMKNVPNLTLRNSKGFGAAMLGVQSYGPGLVLSDIQGALRAQLDVSDDGPRLYLEDKNGFSATVGNYWFGDDSTKNKKSVAASIVLAQKELGRIWSAP